MPKSDAFLKTLDSEVVVTMRGPGFAVRTKWFVPEWQCEAANLADANWGLWCRFS
jgi:hypothetical protein